jgi:hypothetical protein
MLRGYFLQQFVGSSAQAFFVCSSEVDDGGYVAFVVAQQTDSMEKRDECVE